MCGAVRARVCVCVCAFETVEKVTQRMNNHDRAGKTQRDRQGYKGRKWTNDQNPERERERKMRVGEKERETRGERWRE